MGRWEGSNRAGGCAGGRREGGRELVTEGSGVTWDGGIRVDVG